MNNPHQTSYGFLSLIGSVLAVLCMTLALACSDDDGENVVTSSPNPSDQAETPSPSPGTPAPPDPMLATNTFFEFVDFVQSEDVVPAWDLYIASVPDDLTQHKGALGCEYGLFGNELVKMKNMFDRIAPLTVIETFGAAQGSLQIEIKLLGSDGKEYLATLVREPQDAPYRIRFFNSGRPAVVPGAMDPLPSPEDPQGFCGIWTGPR